MPVRSQAICETFNRISINPCSVAAGRPRQMPSRGATPLRSIRSRASSVFSGGKATACCLLNSTSVPPLPQSMTGPNTRSLDKPTMSSRERRAIACTAKPCILASGCCGATSCVIFSAAAAHLLGRSQVQDHATGIGLVDDLGRDDLQGHGKADPHCLPDRFLDIVGPARIRDRDAIRLEQLHRLHRHPAIRGLREVPYRSAFARARAAA